MVTPRYRFRFRSMPAEKEGEILKTHTTNDALHLPIYHHTTSQQATSLHSSP